MVTLPIFRARPRLRRRRGGNDDVRRQCAGVLGRRSTGWEDSRRRIDLRADDRGIDQDRTGSLHERWEARRDVQRRRNAHLRPSDRQRLRQCASSPAPRRPLGCGQARPGRFIPTSGRRFRRRGSDRHRPRGAAGALPRSKCRRVDACAGKGAHPFGAVPGRARTTRSVFTTPRPRVSQRPRAGRILPPRSSVALVVSRGR